MDPANQMYESWKQDFTDGWDLVLQQLTSKFREFITWGEPKKAQGAQVIDHIFPLEADVRTGSDASDTKWKYADTKPRWAFPITLELTVPVTQTDKLHTLADPTNSLVKAINAGHMRAMDDHVIIDAFFRDVIAGKDQDETIAFPNGQVIPHGADGISRDKVDQAFEMFRLAEVDLEAEAPIMGISPRQERILRNLQEVSQKEFEKMGGVIKDGRVIAYLGFKTLVTNRLKKVAGTNYVRCPVWVPSGMHGVTWLDKRIEIGPRPDKNYTTQIYTEMRAGATRAEEGRVIEMQCDEAALPA